MKKKYQIALTIAGSDSGGGAGIQADLKTFMYHKCYGMSVITSLTAQNTTGVLGIHPVPEDFVRLQLEAVLSDIGTDAVKTGMLYSAELIETISNVLQKYKIENLVIDPVMVAKGGAKLLQLNAISTLKNQLIPLAAIVTPNIPEAELMADMSIKNIEDMKKACINIAKLGCKTILLKGGHLPSQIVTDIFYDKVNNEFTELTSDFIESKNVHGTGCTLSAAICANLALGNSIYESVKNAHSYINTAIRFGKEYEIGSGHGPVNHFCQ